MRKSRYFIYIYVFLFLSGIIAGRNNIAIAGALFSVCAIRRTNLYLSIVMVLAGAVFGLSINTFAETVIMLIIIVLWNKGIGKSSVAAVFTASLIPMMIGVFYTDQVILFIIKIISLSMIGALSVNFFEKACMSLDSYRKKSEQKFDFRYCDYLKDKYFYILLSLCASALDAVTLYDFSFGNVAALLFVMLAAQYTDTGTSTAVGVMYGVFTGNVESTLVYGLCGFAAGALYAFGRITTILSIVISVMFFTSYGITGVVTPPEFIIPSLVFVFLPAIREKNNKKTNEENEEYVNNDTFMIEYSGAFSALSDLFGSCDRDNDICENLDVIAENTINRVCADCSFSEYCWKNEYYESWGNIKEALTQFSREGVIEKEVTEKFFRGNCPKTIEMRYALYSACEISSNDKAWRLKEQNMMQHMSKHYDDLSKLFLKKNRATGNEIDILDKEKNIEKILKSKYILNPKVLLKPDITGCSEITIEYGGYNGKENAKNLIESAVSCVMQKNMKIQECAYGNRRFELKNTIHLKPVSKYIMEIGTAVKSAENERGIITCGDSTVTIDNGDGRTVVILSDGMGRGKKAAIQSENVCRISEKLLSLNADTCSVVSFLNTVISTISEGNNFSTMDLMIFDGETGNADLIKIGCCPTIIFRENGAYEIFESKTVPVGMYPHIDYEIINVKLDNEALILMMSDGVWDMYGSVEKIKDSLQGFFLRKPKYIAERIIKDTAELYAVSEIEPDDMTVMVMKVRETS